MNDWSISTMRLSSFNVNEQLINLVQDRFSKETESFTSLKDEITNQQVIPSIHEQIKTQIEQLSSAEKQEKQRTLEQSFIVQQTKEDGRQEQEARQNKDSVQQSLLTYDLAKAQLELVIVKDQLINLDLLSAAQAAERTNHAHPSTHFAPQNNQHGHSSTNLAPQNNQHGHSSTNPAPQNNQHGHSPLVLQTNVIEANRIRSRLTHLIGEISYIQRELEHIEQRIIQRQIEQYERTARLNARLALAENQPGATIQNALSSSNYNDLLRTISKDHSDLNSQCTRLITAAEQLNHSTFIEQLERYLPNMNYLSLQERDALTTVLLLNKKHKEQTRQCENIIEQLNQTNDLLQRAEQQLKTAQNRQLIVKSNPSILTKEIHELSNRNDALVPELKRNTAKSKQLLNLGWVLTGLTVLASSPLLLSSTGILLVTANPALLSLMVIVPALVASALAINLVAGLFFSNKASANRENLRCNTVLIAIKSEQIKDEANELSSLEQTIIPACEQTIISLKKEQSQLESSLKKAKEEAQATLTQAKTTTPGVHSSSTQEQGFFANSMRNRVNEALPHNATTFNPN